MASITMEDEKLDTFENFEKVISTNGGENMKLYKATLFDLVQEKAFGEQFVVGKDREQAMAAVEVTSAGDIKVFLNRIGEY